VVGLTSILDRCQFVFFLVASDIGKKLCCRDAISVEIYLYEL